VLKDKNISKKLEKTFSLKKQKHHGNRLFI